MCQCVFVRVCVCVCVCAKVEVDKPPVTEHLTPHQSVKSSVVIAAVL